MAVNDKKTRVQMTLPTSLVESIDAVCEHAHISRTVFIEYTLGMALSTYHTLLSNGDDAKGEGAAALEEG